MDPLDRPDRRPQPGRNYPLLRTIEERRLSDAHLTTVLRDMLGSLTPIQVLVESNLGRKVPTGLFCHLTNEHRRSHDLCSQRETDNYHANSK